MLSARESIGILLGRRPSLFPIQPERDFLSGVEDLWRTSPSLMREPQDIVGKMFGTVTQLTKRITVYKSKPAIYYNLFCTNCNRPVGEGVNYRQLLGFKAHAHWGCYRMDCMSSDSGDWVQTLYRKHATFQNFARVGITLSLYKLLLPELVPSTYGGTYGLPTQAPHIPTDPEVAMSFCRQMRDGRPYSRAANAATPFLSFKEILEPYETSWSPRFSDRLEKKLLHPETTFFLNHQYPDITFLEMEASERGAFLKFFCREAKIGNYRELDEENDKMASIQKVDNSAVQTMVSDRQHYGAKAKLYAEVVGSAAKLAVGESLLVSGKDDAGNPFDISNFHAFMRRNKLKVGTHLAIRRQLYSLEGEKLDLADRGYIVTKLTEFSFSAEV